LLPWVAARAVVVAVFRFVGDFAAEAFDELVAFLAGEQRGGGAGGDVPA